MEHARVRKSGLRCSMLESRVRKSGVRKSMLD